MRCVTFSRRSFLTALAASYPLFLTGCQSLQSALSVATPTPSSPRVARVAFPDFTMSNYYNTFREQTLIAKPKISAERHVDLQMVPIGQGTIYEESGERYASSVAALTGKDAPDLAITPPVSFIASLAKAGMLQDLEPLLKSERWYKSADFRSNVLQEGTYHGKLLALPLMVSTEVMMYDRTAFGKAGVPLPKAGWTWDECLEAARRLTRPRQDGGAPYWGLLASPGEPTIFSLAWQQGADLIGPKGGIDFTEPGTIKALEILASLSQTHKVAPPLAELPKPGASWTTWERPYAAMWTRLLPGNGQSWWLRSADVGLAELPKGSRQVTLGSVDMLVGIPKNAPDVGHSLNALRGLVEASDRAMLLPPRLSASEVSKIGAELPPGDATVLSAALSAARFISVDFEPSQEVGEIWGRELLEAVYSGQKPPEQAARDAQKRLDEIQARERNDR